MHVSIVRSELSAKSVASHFIICSHLSAFHFLFFILTLFSFLNSIIQNCHMSCHVLCHTYVVLCAAA